MAKDKMSKKWWCYNCCQIVIPEGDPRVCPLCGKGREETRAFIESRRLTLPVNHPEYTGHAYTDSHLYEIPPAEEFVDNLKTRLAALACDARRAAYLHEHSLGERFYDAIAEANAEITLWHDRAIRRYTPQAETNRNVERDEKGNPKGDGR